MKTMKQVVTDKSLAKTLSRTGLLMEEHMESGYSIDKTVVMLGKGCCGKIYAEQARNQVEMRMVV